MNREQRRQWRQYVLGCPDLTPAQRVVLLALETFAVYPAGTNARPGVDALAQMCGFGRRVVLSALDAGRRLKLIEPTARANPVRGWVAVYRLLPVPISRCTSVHIEAGFKVHEPAIQGARNAIQGARARTDTNPINTNPKTPKGLGACTKATYLPADWSPAAEVVAQMRAEQTHIEQELELKRFRDHWHSTTRNAQKRDWNAAYRNWIRNTAKWASRNGQALDGQTAYERKTAHNRAVFESLADDPPTPELEP